MTQVRREIVNGDKVKPGQANNNKGFGRVLFNFILCDVPGPIEYKTKTPKMRDVQS